MDGQAPGPVEMEKAAVGAGSIAHTQIPGIPRCKTPGGFETEPEDGAQGLGAIRVARVGWQTARAKALRQEQPWGSKDNVPLGHRGSRRAQRPDKRPPCFGCGHI